MTQASSFTREPDQNSRHLIELLRLCHESVSQCRFHRCQFGIDGQTRPVISTRTQWRRFSQLPSFVDQHEAFDFVGLKPDGHRLPHAGQYGGIVQLGDQAAVQSQPVRDRARVQIDNLQATLRLGFAFLKLIVQRESVETAVPGL